MFDTMYFSWQERGYTWMKAVSAIYYVSFLLIGNYILMNLFLAILIDSFLEEGEEEDGEQEMIQEARDPLQ